MPQSAVSCDNPTRSNSNGLAWNPSLVSCGSFHMCRLHLCLIKKKTRKLKKHAIPQRELAGSQLTTILHAPIHTCSESKYTFSGLESHLCVISVAFLSLVFSWYPYLKIFPLLQAGPFSHFYNFCHPLEMNR